MRDHLKLWLLPNNEEQFLSAYHTQLMKIRGKYKYMPNKDESQQCPCHKCYRNPIPLDCDFIPTLQSPKRKRTHSQNKKNKKKPQPSTTTTTTTITDTLLLPSTTVTDAATLKVVLTNYIDLTITTTQQQKQQLVLYCYKQQQIQQQQQHYIYQQQQEHNLLAQNRLLYQ